MSDIPDSQPSPSGDQAPLLVRLAERLSKRPETGKDGLTIDRALWAMVLVQLAQMDTGNLSWVLAYLL